MNLRNGYLSSACSRARARALRCLLLALLCPPPPLSPAPSLAPRAITLTCGSLALAGAPLIHSPPNARTARSTLLQSSANTLWCWNSSANVLRLDWRGAGDNTPKPWSSLCQCLSAWEGELVCLCLCVREVCEMSETHHPECPRSKACAWCLLTVSASVTVAASVACPRPCLCVCPCLCLGLCPCLCVCVCVCAGGHRPRDGCASGHCAHIPTGA